MTVIMETKRKMRHKRLRQKIKGTASRPRLCVFRSPKHISAQIVDDRKGKTLASVSDREVGRKKFPKEYAGKKGKAYIVGQLIARKAQEKKIKEAVFDRGGYKYHGRVKALAEGARKEGLKF